MADIPPPPPGFVPLEPQAAAAPPPPPPGFVPMESAAPTAGPGTDDGFRPPPLQMAPPGAGEGSLRIDMTKPKPSLVDTIMDAGNTAARYGTQAVAGAREGAVNIAGLPVDIVSAIYNLPAGMINRGLDAVGFGDEQLNLGPGDQISAPPEKGPRLPIISKPVGGGEFLNDLFPTAPKPQTYGERLTRRVGQEVGATAVPVVGGIVKGAQVGVEGARQMSPLARTFVEPAAIAPKTFAAKEFSGATAAGGAAHTVGELTGKNKAEAAGKHATAGQQIADAAAAGAGYGIGSVGVRAGGMAKDVLGAIFGTPKMTNKVARDVAVDEIVRAAGLEPPPKGAVNTAPLVADATIPNKTFEAVPGYKPSLADLTGNEGLAAKEYGRSLNPDAAGTYKRVRDSNIKAVDDAMEANAPQGQPGTFKDALEIERDSRIGAASTARTDAEAAAATAVAPVTPNPNATRQGRGDIIRGEADTARATARQATRDAYDAADVNNVPLRPTFLAEALDNTTAGLSQAERSFAPQGLIDRVAQIPAGEPATLREATSLRTVLVDQQRAALADPARRYEARVLGQYIEAVEDVIGQSVSAEQRAALETARQARRAEAEAFERRGDPVAQITARHPGGLPKMSDENVARAATRDDVIDRLFQEADTPATRAAIRDELLTNADTSTAAGIHAFQQQYREQIARFPGLDAELGAAIRARVAENTARGAEGGILKEIGQDGRGVVAKYLQYGDENAEKAMRAVLANKDPARAIDDLLSFVHDNTAAVEGARKVFWDLMKKDTKSAGSTTGTVRDNTQPYLPARLKGFLDDPKTAAVMERLYRDNPDHLENIRKVADAIQNIEVRSKGKAAGSSGTAQGAGSILPTAETISSRAFALQRGQVGPTFLAVNMLSIIARKAMAKQQGALIGKIVDKALLEPDFAATLLKENNPANRAAMARGARGWMGNEASTLTQMLQDDPDADVKAAIGR